MTPRVLLSQLNVVGFIGQAKPSQAPMWLMPVYQSRTESWAIVPPATEQGDYVEGHQISLEHLDDLVADGEVTRIDSPTPAAPNHEFWMLADGPRYLPPHQAKILLERLAMDAIREAVRAGLSSMTAGRRLTDALCARQTVVATALLCLHYEQTGKTGELDIAREDLETLRSEDTGGIERHQLQAALPMLQDSRVKDVFVRELVRAGRNDLVDEMDRLKERLPLRPIVPESMLQPPPLISIEATQISVPRASVGKAYPTVRKGLDLDHPSTDFSPYVLPCQQWHSESASWPKGWFDWRPRL